MNLKFDKNNQRFICTTPNSSLFVYFSPIMQFVYPWFLWALAAISIPVIIHLFNFRRYKTVYFSNVKFLKEVQQETTSRNRLKHLLVLAARVLAIIFLVLAFAQPYLPGQKNTSAAGKKAVSIYVDNSFSMNATGSGTNLLDKAKLTAKEIANSYGAADEFQLLTNDFEGKHQRMVSRDEFLSMLQEVELSPTSRNLKDIAQRQSAALYQTGEQNKMVYLLSDFQQHMGTLQPDSAISYNLVPYKADEQANLFIDSAWFNEPVQIFNRTATLMVKVSNSGENAAENVRLSFKLNGQTKSMNELTIQPGSFVVDTFSFLLNQPNWNKAELTISDQPIVFDDSYYLAFNVHEKINVLCINNGVSNKYIDAFFSNKQEFQYTTFAESAFQGDMLNDAQFLVLENLPSISSTLATAANKFCADGGSVALFPAPAAETESYNRLLNSMRANSITGFTEQPQEVSGINMQENVFKDVFDKVPQNMSLPVANKYYTFTTSSATTEAHVLTLKDGASFLSKYSNGTGNFYVCAAPLNKECSDLPVHALFVPLLYKMSIGSLGKNVIATFAGSAERVEVKGTAGSKEAVYKVSGQGIEFIPEQYASGNKVLLGISEQIKKAGFYTVSNNMASETQTIAINFNRKESVLKFFDAFQLQQQYLGNNIHIVNGAGANVASVVSELHRGTSLWKWCIMAALIFLATEILLLRFWKT